MRERAAPLTNSANPAQPPSVSVLSNPAAPPDGRGSGRLHIASAVYVGDDGFLIRPQPVGGQLDPAGQSWAGQLHWMAPSVDLFLSVEGKLIAVFPEEDVREQASRGQATILQALRQRGDERGAAGPPGMISDEQVGDKLFAIADRRSAMGAREL